MGILITSFSPHEKIDEKSTIRISETAPQINGVLDGLKSNEILHYSKALFWFDLLHAFLIQRVESEMEVENSSSL